MMIVLVDDTGAEREFENYAQFREWWFSDENKGKHIKSLKTEKDRVWLKTDQIPFRFSQQRQRRKTHK